MNVKKWIFCAFAIWIGTGQSFAQDVDSSQVGRFQLAESFIRAAQYERAIALLEDLYEGNPGTHVFYERLREAYESVKRYDAAISLIDKKIASETSPTIYVADKARLQFLKGDEITARKTWQSAIELNPASSSVYLLVYRSLMQVRLFDYSIEVLEEGRDRLGNSALFQTDLAQLYNLTSQHDKAVAQYLDLLKINQNQLNYVRSQMGPFLTTPESLEKSIGVVEAGVAEEPLNRAFREFLAWLYVENSQYRLALDVYRAIDRLEREEGRMLFSFAQVASEGGAYDVALEAFDEVLRRYPTGPSAPDALRGLGLMQEKWAVTLGEAVFDMTGKRLPKNHFDEALDTYQRFLIEYPQHPFFPDVLRRIGLLHQDVFYDYTSAYTVLTEVIGRYPQTIAADQAAYDLGRLAIMENRLEDSKLEFSRLLTRLRTGELADLARYELALLHFYKGEFETAQGFTEAMQENTSTDVANDAIAMKVLLIENRGPDSLDVPLKKYAKTKLLTRQRKWEASLHQLEDLMEEFGSHPLADEMLFDKAELLARNAQPEQAVQSYLELPLIHPASFLSDKSLFKAALIQSTMLGQKEAAIATFQRILTEYPGSLLLTRAREEIRILRGDEV
ncbi:tetratricopeptide repeat protein [bacterium]|nr:tetratricopeptide repeat protein [bacterium]